MKSLYTRPECSDCNWELNIPCANHAANSAELLAAEVTEIAYTKTGWKFSFRAKSYTMPDPYPEMLLPTDSLAARFCIKALIQGTAS